MNQHIDGQTRMLALLGSPVSHSLSPAIHNASAAILGLNYVYTAIEIPPEKIEQAILAIRTFNLAGVNLTMPLKEACIPFLDKLSPASELIGAVNTIVNEDGFLTGHITDGVGYFKSLDVSGFKPAGNTMSLLGAGGAAKAILVQAALDGMKKIHVFKRKNSSFEEFENFTKTIVNKTGCDIILHDINDQEALESSILDSDLLTNATKVGMGKDNTSLVNPKYFHKNLLVSDIIYNPLITPMMQQAMDLGIPVIGGKDMLLYQAAESFRLWTGREMPTEQVRTKINF